MCVEWQSHTAAHRYRRIARVSISEVADLAEVQRLIAEALPGAEVEVIDEAGGDHLRAVVNGTPVRGPQRGSTSTGWCGPRSGT